MILPTGNNNRSGKWEVGSGKCNLVPTSNFQFPISRHGLTLIELLVTVVLLSTSVVLIMQALARGAHSVRLAQHRLAAYTFLVAKMADVELNLNAGSELRPHGEFRTGGTLFQWQLNTLPVMEEPRLEQVSLVVGWRQGPHRYESQVSTFRRVLLPTP